MVAMCKKVQEKSIAILQRKAPKMPEIWNWQIQKNVTVSFAEAYQMCQTVRPRMTLTENHVKVVKINSQKPSNYYF